MHQIDGSRLAFPRPALADYDGDVWCDHKGLPTV